ncbi:uncharacterized protein METZ01_LOCUS332409 [marine metagenome]|uniref:Uncharacterized protein n=1 Tax=marine metagenome TaxID=408172 RepID=A0A382Q3P5_9ZZZZ
MVYQKDVFDLNDTISQTQKLSRELVLSHPQNLRKKLKFY